MSIDTSSLKIILYPDPRLRKPCQHVDKFDDDLAQLARRMLELMREAEGIGLAAPQVGIPLRLFVCNITDDPAADRVLVNPTLSNLQGELESEEGCLSIPDVTVKLLRAESCTLSAVDLTGKPIVEVADELLSRCWQHECDHLDGRLIIDRMSEADKIANRRVLKQLEADHKKQPARR